MARAGQLTLVVVLVVLLVVVSGCVVVLVVVVVDVVGGGPVCTVSHALTMPGVPRSPSDP